MTITVRTPVQGQHPESSKNGGSAGSGVHYNIDPEVFELLLDRNMHYSSGYYQHGHEDLDSAQETKLEKAGTWLGLRQGSRLLDVGCGWCGPALHFAWGARRIRLAVCSSHVELATRGADG